jgi:hypothetical protein
VIRIDTPLLVSGEGPAALVVAKVAGGLGRACLLLAHDLVTDEEPVTLGADAEAVLDEHGLIDVLRPHLASRHPLAISPREFETVLTQHCVADVNVTVYDTVTVVEQETEGGGLRGVLTDGRRRWELAADVFVDANHLPSSLSDAITSGVAAALAAVRSPHILTPGSSASAPRQRGGRP